MTVNHDVVGSSPTAGVLIKEHPKRVFFFVIDKNRRCNQMKKTKILFDLDGTIIEPSQGIFQSVNYAMEKMNRIKLSNETLKTFVGPPLEESFVSLGMSLKEAKEAISYYRVFYRETGIYLFIAYEGIEEVLTTLSKNNQLYLATSKPELFAKVILESLNYSQYFTGIYGANLEGTRSKKADVIRHAFKESNIVERNQVVMIGDRKHDIIGAVENNIESIGVLYGFGDKEELQTAGATKIAASVKDLLVILS